MNHKMTLGERALSLISPRAAAQRLGVRLMATDANFRDTVLTLRRQTRGYQAANPGKGAVGWMGGGGAADNFGYNGQELAEKAREKQRDDSLASGLLEQDKLKAVGTGLVPQANTGDAALDERIEGVWWRYCDKLYPADNLTHTEGQGLALLGLRRDGDMLVKQAYSEDIAHTWFENVERERLATPLGVNLADYGNAAGEIRDGVERDANGRITHYWISKAHPGDYVRMKPRTLGVDGYVRVPAEYCRHLRLIDRAGQTRGITSFHAILQDLHDLGFLMTASLKRVEMAACFALVMESEMSYSDLNTALGLEETDDYAYDVDAQITPGMIMHARPGTKASTISPNFPTPELFPFIVSICRRIGAATGRSWQHVLHDFSDSTYSSARTDQIEAWETWDFLQWYLIEHLLTWQWVTVLTDLRMRGEPDLRGVTDQDLSRVEWIPPARRWVDPLKEAQANEVGLRVGWLTMRYICTGLGTDWRQVFDQKAIEIAYWREACQRNGLPPNTPMMGGAPSQPKPEAFEPGEEEGEDKEIEEGNGKAKRLRYLLGAPAKRPD
jgi:lambda family phage portal protein